MYDIASDKRFTFPQRLCPRCRDEAVVRRQERSIFTRKKFTCRLWLESIITGRSMAELFREQLRDSAEEEEEKGGEVVE